MKNPKLLSNHNEIWSKLPAYEYGILTKFLLDWAKDVDFFITGELF